MSDRDNDAPDRKLDPPENTGGGNNMSLDPAGEPSDSSTLDPPENTEERTDE